MSRSRSASFSFNTVSLLLVALLVVTFVVFLGQTLFNTKGEPREAIVAVSILQQGNWVLPVSCGGDIPYKPPFLAWCIAAFGWLNGGIVTEFISRLPSALAMIIMTVTGFRFFARRATPSVALAMSLITMTAFEVHRAATSCRVDMLLTMFIVTSLYALYRHYENRSSNWWNCPWLAILLMSGGVLTKGPVGMLLPCGVVFLFRLIRGDRFWRSVAELSVSGLLALVLPAIWYIAAYRQGGYDFLRLAMEENFGRFAGTMSYRSHENPFWYNFLTLFAGFSPYTLLLVVSLTVSKRFAVNGLKLRLPSFSGIVGRLRAMDPVELFSLVAIVFIFVFYCIPKSKRSVYLLPVYPFIAYYIAIYVRWLSKKAVGVLRVYGWIVLSVGFVAAAIMLAAMFGVLPALGGDSGFNESLQYVRFEGSGFLASFFCCLVLAVMLGTARVMTSGDGRQVAQWILFDTVVIYWMFSASIQPAALNPRSDLRLAQAIEEEIPAGRPIYSYISDGLLRFYTADFYLDDRIKRIDKTSERPSDGWILVSVPDREELQKVVAPEYEYTEIFTTSARSCDTRRPVSLLRFELRDCNMAD